MSAASRCGDEQIFKQSTYVIKRDPPLHNPFASHQNNVAFLFDMQDRVTVSHDESFCLRAFEPLMIAFIPWNHETVPLKIIFCSFSFFFSARRRVAC